jgi:beta-glucosidase
MTHRRFPPDFVFGAATSAFQIEGATTRDGRGPSIWDTFCATPGRVAGGDTGEPACDHLARYRSDVQILRELGVSAYRFSVAWPRIFPTGLETRPLAAGLDVYERLVDALGEAGIAPWLTLYHWDLPQGLQDHGGWANRLSIDAFTRLAEAVARRMGPRVGHYITHNEPWCVAHLGHVTGEHAPGHRDQWPEALTVAHHVLVSHGRATLALRAEAPHAQVGITLNLCPAYPASPSAADADATRHFDGFFNRWYLDPVLGRGYPADQVADYQRLGRLPPGPLPFVADGDLETIAVRTDFLGINYYSRAICRSDAIPESENLPRVLHEVGPEGRTDIGWEVFPQGLGDLLRRLAALAPGLPIVVTENGASDATPPDADGRVPDHRRRAYLQTHLDACQRAIADGVPLIGYFAWSLMDNFEWAYGYAQRFGLFWVDYTTQERRWKDSARWYARLTSHGDLDRADAAPDEPPALTPGAPRS